MTSSQTPASHSDLQELASRFAFSDAATERAFELAGLRPGGSTWRDYIGWFTLVVGTALIIAGVAAFFAWNWADLRHFTKFGLIEAGIVVCVIAAWKLGLDSAAGKATLFVAGFLVGVLFAVYGQVYQTGADPYGLFLSWALLVLPWALIGRQHGLWLLWVVLVNLAVIMYWTQVLDPPEGIWQLAQLFGPLFLLGALLTDSVLSGVVFAINAVALVAWEAGAARGSQWMRGALLPRAVAFLALAVVLPPTVIVILAATFGESIGLSLLSPVLLGLATAACIYYYQFRKTDLFILTCCAVAIITTVTSLAIKLMLGGAGSMLLLSLLLIGQVAAAAYWLRGVSRRWESV